MRPRCTAVRKAEPAVHLLPSREVSRTGPEHLVEVRRQGRGLDHRHAVQVIGDIDTEWFCQRVGVDPRCHDYDIGRNDASASAHPCHLATDHFDSIHVGLGEDFGAKTLRGRSEGTDGGSGIGMAISGTK